MGSKDLIDPRSLLEIALDAVIAMDRDGRITEFNSEAERIFGWTRAEALGRPLAELVIPAALRDMHRAGLARYLDSAESRIVGQRVELTAVRRDGSEVPVEVAVCRVPGSKPPLFVGFLRDLSDRSSPSSERRLAEERDRRFGAEAAADSERQRAERLEERLTTIVEATPDFVGFADAKTGGILYINRAGKRMCGLADDCDVHDLRVRDVHPDWANRRLADVAFPAAMEHGTWSGEISFLSRDGREIPTDMILMAHRGPDGEVEIFSTISRDISERRRAEEVARQLFEEKLARKAAEEAVRVRDEFVFTAGHELKTPLTSLLLQIEVMKRKLPWGTSPDMRERLDKITHGGTRLQKLIEQLLDVSLITAGRLMLEPERFDLLELLREVISRFEEPDHSSGQITMKGSTALAGVWDRSRIDQVLTNLVSNAVKYGLGRPIEIEILRERGSAVVRVTDHGLGIAQDHKERIFGRFERAVTTRQFAGLGLGLWISRQIVEASGGAITVQSEPGNGSTFTVRLPLEADEDGALPAPR
jgi:PAS domain S-box-containing protein